MAQERIQKILSRAGISSRRKAEELISEGGVTINGKTAKLGDKAEFGTDAIKVRGKLLQGGARPPIYIAFHKPRGVISMFSDPEGRPTLEDYFRRFGERLFPVGRLDFMSEGLLLVTNDGDFAERVQKSSGVPRVYRVKVKGRPEAATVAKLARPTRVDGKLVHPHSVKLVDHFTSKSLVEVVLIGSGAIDLKTLFERNGVLVDRITRTSIGQVTLKEMAPGTFRLLRRSQAEAIFTNPELAIHRIEQEQEKANPRSHPIVPLPAGSRAVTARTPAERPARSGARPARSAEPTRPGRAVQSARAEFSAGASSAKRVATGITPVRSSSVKLARAVASKPFSTAARPAPKSASDPRYGRYHDLPPEPRARPERAGPKAPARIRRGTPRR